MTSQAYAELAQEAVKDAGADAVEDAGPPPAANLLCNPLLTLLRTRNKELHDTTRYRCMNPESCLPTTLSPLPRPYWAQQQHPPKSSPRSSLHPRMLAFLGGL
jgi:hypothetical protein